MSEVPSEPILPRDVARILSEIATLMELNGRDAFRARAFASAARALEGTDADLAALARENRLTELRGIGRGIASVVAEIVETGRSTPYEELRAATPIGLYELLRIPGLGTKRIHTLHEKLDIDSLDALEAAGEAGRIARLPGFGARTEQKIMNGLRFAREARARRRYPEALEVAARLLDALRDHPAVDAASITGAIRRRMEVVSGVDLVAASGDPERAQADFFALNGFAADPAPLDDGRLAASLTDGLEVRLRCVPPEHYVAAVAWDTGSDAHVTELVERADGMGFELTPEGLLRDGNPVALADEEVLYRRLELAYVPAELREGLGEIEAAARDRVPPLVALDDLRGTFHCHTTASDGKATLDEMAQAAVGRGWAYLGIADHSRSAGYAGGLTIERLRAQIAEIGEWNAARARSRAEPFRLFAGTESDILADGRLDYPDEVLFELDYVVASVHSSFGMPRDEMTKRMIRAVRHPALTILGHPTGRLLLSREGYDVDVRAVIDAAAEAGVAIEINANPHRLDLDWREVRYAAERGVIIAIDPDAHSVKALEHVAFGVNMARKAGLEPARILNCWTVEEVERYLAERKQSRKT